MKTTKEDRHERAVERVETLKAMWGSWPQAEEGRQDYAIVLLENICGILTDQQQQMEEFLEFAEDQLQAQARMETQLKTQAKAEQP